MRVLIIDDDRELATMLIEFLAGEGMVAEHEGNGARGLQRAREGDFDAVVLDVMLPAMNGFDVLRGLRACNRVPVIMLSARGEDSDRILGLELGADDYQAKPFNPRELAARLRAVTRRGSPADDDNPPLTEGKLLLDRRTRQVSLDGLSLTLTAAEFAVLECLMLSPGEVVSKDAMADHALGRKLSAFDRSVDTHISRLRSKLAVTDTGAPVIQAIRGRGYVMLRSN